MESLNRGNIWKIRKELGKKVSERVNRGENDGVHFNSNPIAPDTYARIFTTLIRPGDVVVNVGAGLALDPTGNLNFLNQKVLEACEAKKATLLSVDNFHPNVLTHQDLKTITGSEQLQAIQADGRKLPLRDSSVSGIVSSNLINCPPNGSTLQAQAEELLSEAWRVLRPGGFVVLSSFGYRPDGKDEQERQIYNNDLKEEDLLTLAQLERTLVAKGFNNVSELEVDAEIQEHTQIHVGTRISYREDGGFIAYKPKEEAR